MATYVNVCSSQVVQVVRFVCLHDINQATGQAVVFVYAVTFDALQVCVYVYEIQPAGPPCLRLLHPILVSLPVKGRAVHPSIMLSDRD